MQRITCGNSIINLNNMYDGFKISKNKTNIKLRI